MQHAGADLFFAEKLSGLTVDEMDLVTRGTIHRFVLGFVGIPITVYPVLDLH